jgi:hypothetical protein
MADPLQMQMMLSNLQNQITAMNGLTNPQQSTPAISQPNINQLVPNIQPDIYTMVKDAVQLEIKKLGLDNKQPLPQKQQSQTNPIASILPVIGAAYTKEQQEWISQPQNLIGIPGFLMSGYGKDVLNIALDEYQKFVQGTKTD